MNLPEVQSLPSFSFSHEAWAQHKEGEQRARHEDRRHGDFQQGEIGGRHSGGLQQLQAARWLTWSVERGAALKRGEGCFRRCGQQIKKKRMMNQEQKVNHTKTNV